MSQNEQFYAKLFITGITKIGNFSKSIPLKQMSGTTTSSHIKGVQKSPPSPKISPKSTKSSSNLSKKSPKSPKLISQFKKLSLSHQNSEVKRINFRMTGRDDFLTRRFWCEHTYHEDKDKSFNILSNEDLSSYKQNQFGFSVAEEEIISDDNLLAVPTEWQSLGPLILKKINEKKINNSIYTHPSLINAILISTYPDYQLLEDDETKLEMCQQLFNDAAANLSSTTVYPSNTAKLLNPLVKGWLTNENLYPLAFNILKARNEIPSEFDIEIDETGVPRIRLTYFEGDNIMDVVVDDRLTSPTKPVVLNSYGQNSNKLRNKKQNFIAPSPQILSIVEQQLIDHEEGFPDQFDEIEAFYIWKGDFDTLEDMLDSISNKDYLAEMLRLDNIDENSIFYNCRGGSLFRYWHINDFTCKDVQEQLDFDAVYQDLLVYSHIVDNLGIAVKTFSMPDEDDNTEDISYFEPEYIKGESNSKNIYKYVDRDINPRYEENQYSTIGNRTFCIPKNKFSFYPTAEYDDEDEVNYYYKLWSSRKAGKVSKLINESGGIFSYIFKNGIGNLLWGNHPSNNNIPVVYTYYHHFDPECTNAENNEWVDSNTHHNSQLEYDTNKKGVQIITPEDDYELNGIYIPLAQVIPDLGLVKTIFNI